MSYINYQNCKSFYLPNTQNGHSEKLFLRLYTVHTLMEWMLVITQSLEIFKHIFAYPGPIKQFWIFFYLKILSLSPLFDWCWIGGFHKIWICILVLWYTVCTQITSLSPILLIHKIGNSGIFFLYWLN